jgi:hypothetical protein
VQQAFAPNLKRFTGGMFVGSYGPRVAEQMPNVIDILSRLPDSRQAIVHTHDSVRDGLRTFQAARDRSEGAHDIPCITEIHLWVRKMRVHVHAVMRSTDLWMGLYYDIPYVSFLAARLAEALMVGLGEVWLSTSSLHLYERNWRKLRHYVSGVKWDDTDKELNPSLWDRAPLHDRQNYTRTDSITPRWLPPTDDDPWHWPTPGEAMDRWIRMRAIAYERLGDLLKEANNATVSRTADQTPNANARDEGDSVGPAGVH